jgi:hypothetical protein
MYEAYTFESHEFNSCLGYLKTGSMQNILLEGKFFGFGFYSQRDKVIGIIWKKQEA